MKIGRRSLLGASAVVAALGGAAVYLAKPFQARRLTAAEKQACGLTVEAVEGPYHVSGMTELKDGNLVGLSPAIAYGLVLPIDVLRRKVGDVALGAAQMPT